MRVSFLLADNDVASSSIKCDGPRDVEGDVFQRLTMQICVLRTSKRLR